MTTDHLDPSPTSDRTDEVIREVRKQGRAAIAAQAAAESCIEALAELRELVDRATPAPEDPSASEGWVRALMPVSDALDRIVAETERRAREPRGSWVARLLGRAPTEPERALAEGVLLLRRQLEDALAAHGVAIDRRVGVPFDPETQRAVALAPQGDHHPSGIVVSVLRPGFSLAGRILREADVSVVE